MTDDDVDTIEAQLGVTMPPEYRAFIRNPPTGGGKACSPSDKSDRRCEHSHSINGSLSRPTAKKALRSPSPRRTTARFPRGNVRPRVYGIKSAGKLSSPVPFSEAIGTGNVRAYLQRYAG